MMPKFILNGIIVCVFTAIPRIAVTQIVIERLIQNLQNCPVEGVVINATKFDHKIVTLPKEYKCYTGHHHYLWFNKKLVIQVDGSGKLYEVSPDKPAKRMDNTCYEGYNFMAFNFIYKDTLFSLGGYGFWMDNGQLRYYDEKNSEWFLMATGKTLPFNRVKSKFYYDVADKKIYLLFQHPILLSADKSQNRDDANYVQCLDLLTKRWWNDPLPLNKKLDSIVNNITEFSRAGFHTKQGLLMDLDFEFNLYDFKNNKVKDIRPAKKAIIFNSISRPFDKLLFSKDSSLHLFNSLTGEIDSIPFGNADLIDTDIPIYLPLPRKEKEVKDSQQLVSFSLVAILLLLTGLVIIRFQKMRQKISLLTMQAEATIETTQPEGILIQHKQSFKANLTEAERNLLELLINNSLIDAMTSVNQMNQVLGLGKKPVKIQNNLRAAAVLMINKKFKAYSGYPDDLLEKHRTEFDKRFFEYNILRKYLSKIR